jgi:hypothetical protein
MAPGACTQQITESLFEALFYRGLSLFGDTGKTGSLEGRVSVRCELIGLNHECTTRCENPEGARQTPRNQPFTALENRSLAHPIWMYTEVVPAEEER